MALYNSNKYFNLGFLQDFNSKFKTGEKTL